MVDTPDTEVITPPSVSEVVESAETIELKSVRPQDDKDNNPGQASQGDVLANAKALVSDLAERAKSDKGAPFEPDVLSALAILRQGDPAEYQRFGRGFGKPASRGATWTARCKSRIFASSMAARTTATGRQNAPDLTR